MKSLKNVKVIPTKGDLSTVIQWLSTEKAIFLRVEQRMAGRRIHRGVNGPNTAFGTEFDVNQPFEGKRPGTRVKNSQVIPN